MSKVKFIELSAASKSEYDKKISDTKLSYPGAIIFVTYTDDTDNNKQKQEIWANEKKYEVGGAAGNVIYGDVPVNANGDADGYTGSEGSIYVYTSEKTQTAYYWKDNKWNPFNVDAENIWFHEDITLAGNYTQVGNFTKSQTGTSSVLQQMGESGTYSLKMLLEKMFSKEERDTSDWSYIFTSALSDAPTITFSKQSGDFNYTQNASYAIVGTTITVSYTTPSSTASQSASVTPRFGYYLGSGTTKLTGTKTVIGTPNALTDSFDTVSLSANKSGILSDSILTVASGSQTVTATASGKTYSLDTTVTDPQVTPLNNLGQTQGTLTLDTTNWGQNQTTITANPTTNIRSITGVYPVYFEGVNKWTSIHSGNVKNSSTKFVKTKSNTEIAVLEVPTEKAGTLQVYAAGQWTNHTSYTTSTVSKTINGLTVSYTQYKPNAADGDGTEYRLV